jgi:hypothetical protein
MEEMKKGERENGGKEKSKTNGKRRKGKETETENMLASEASPCMRATAGPLQEL